MEELQSMYQVSTLQALLMGYSKTVVTVKELLKHGNTGLGTFEDVNGEMIVLDGVCYRAADDGSVTVVDPETGVPFAAVTQMKSKRTFQLGEISGIDDLKNELTLRVEEDFGLNSMHVVRIDGSFERVSARSESGYRAHHVTLKEALSHTQRDFYFDNLKGSLVCIYYPDYMDGINAAGWHFHFVSEDKKLGGHVFDLCMKEGSATLDKISMIDIRLPMDAAFDTYSLKEVSKDEVKSVEQGKG
ncbi:MAG: acetolactate decarboxylase [Lachnospiraceae bacterium]|nr:acetolactate decarboxylase [Lachnospiraceae bacterium]